MQRGLASEVLRRMEQRGLKLVGLKLMQIDEALARQHYAEHDGKPFFPGLVSYITSAPVVAAVFEGPRAISIVRTTIGVTDPAEATPGSLRADYGLDKGRNMVHASDSPESAEREINLFFKQDELITWQRDSDTWILE